METRCFKCQELFAYEVLYGTPVALYRRRLKKRYSHVFGPQMVLEGAVCASCKGSRNLVSLPAVLAIARRVKDKRERIRKETSKWSSSPVTANGPACADCGKQRSKSDLFVNLEKFPGEFLGPDVSREEVEANLICHNCLCNINPERNLRSECPVRIQSYSEAIEPFEREEARKQEDLYLLFSSRRRRTA